MEKLKAVREFLVKPENITVHVAANIDKLSALGDTQSPWLTCITDGAAHCPGPVKWSVAFNKLDVYIAWACS